MVGIVPFSIAQVGEKYFFTMHITCQEGQKDFVEYSVNSFKEIGINVVVYVTETIEKARLLSQVPELFDEGGWDFAAQHVNLGPDPDMSFYYHSDNISPEGTGNYPAFNNGKSDALLEAGRQELNDTKRAEIYREWLALIEEEEPYIFFMRKNALTPFSTKIVGGLEEYGKWLDAWGTDIVKMAQFMELKEGEDTYICTSFYRSPNFIDIIGWSLTSGTTSSLLKTNPASGEALPCVAENWTISEDGLTFTFKIRDDIVWSDDVPFTAEDVVFTYESLMNPDLGAVKGSTFRSHISSVGAPDNRTVVIHLKETYAALPYLVGYRWGIGMVPKHCLEDVPFEDWKTSDWNLVPGELPSLGPYIPKEMVVNEYTLYERNDKWFGWGEDDAVPANKAPKYVRKEIILEKATALLALETGEIDTMEHFYYIEDEYERLKGVDTVQLLVSPTLYTECFVPNMRHAILSNKWVRKAISYAIPRKGYCETILSGLSLPISLPIPKTSWAYNEELADIDPHERNIEKAKEFMEKAGYRYEYLEAATVSFETWWVVASVVGGIVIGVAATVVIYRLRRPRT